MSKTNEPFPWQQIMSFGFGLLRLSPAQFWQLSLPELKAAIDCYRPNEQPSITRQWLVDAMQQHPDRDAVPTHQP